MTAGLPGTGIGGLFYLVAALCLPLRFVWLRARGHHDGRQGLLVCKQLMMSMSMIAAVWLTGALLGLWRPLPTRVAVAPIVIIGGILMLVLVAVEIGRLIIRPPSGFGRGWPGNESSSGGESRRVGAARAPHPQKTGRST